MTKHRGWHIGGTLIPMEGGIMRVRESGWPTSEPLSSDDSTPKVGFTEGKSSSRVLISLTVSFTPTSTWCHSHCPVELCVRGLWSQSSYINNFQKSVAKPGLEGFGGVSELPAMHHLAWTLPWLQAQDTLTLSHFQVLCPEDNPPEI